MRGAFDVEVRRGARRVLQLSSIKRFTDLVVHVEGWIISLCLHGPEVPHLLLHIEG